MATRMFVPGTRVSLLSTPGKMPSQSFSLPADKACPYMLTGPGTVCAHCYAKKGRYVMPPVRNALEKRFEWVNDCMARGDAGMDEFVSTMVEAITRSVKSQTGDRVFRVHDSGDLFAPWYVRAWIRVCESLPYVSFWFPTRSWRAKAGPMRDALLALHALPNVTVKPSALFEDVPPPRIPGFGAGTGVTTLPMVGMENLCPAPQQKGKCLDCRRCWGKDNETVYSIH